MMKNADQLSHELREETSPHLRRRRRIVGLSLIASASLGVVTLYQMGLIKHLPEPPLPLLDGDTVNASTKAYELFAVPDAILGLGSYAATMGLAAMGGKDRTRETPLIPLAMAAKVAFDAANAARLSAHSWRTHRAFCMWCLITATATFAMVPLAIPEAVEAARHL